MRRFDRYTLRVTQAVAPKQGYPTMSFKTDIQIAREAKKRPIQEIGAKLDIGSDHLLPYGHDKAKVSQEFINGSGQQERQADFGDRDQPDASGRR